MKDTINKGLLIFAIGQQLFCKACKRVLDVDDAVLMELTRADVEGSSTRVICGACFDRAKERLFAVAAERGLNLEIIDGRTLKNVREAK